MNIEQRREYIEKARQMQEGTLLKESKRAAFRVDLSSYGTMIILAAGVVSMGLGVLDHLGSKYLVPTIFCLGAGYLVGKLSDHYMAKSNILINEGWRRKLNVPISSFQRNGMALVRAVRSAREGTLWKE